MLTPLEGFSRNIPLAKHNICVSGCGQGEVITVILQSKRVRLKRERGREAF